MISEMRGQLPRKPVQLLRKVDRIKLAALQMGPGVFEIMMRIYDFLKEILHFIRRK